MDPFGAPAWIQVGGGGAIHSGPHVGSGDPFGWIGWIVWLAAAWSGQRSAAPVEG
jgi:hypothetical protein